MKKRIAYISLCLAIVWSCWGLGGGTTGQAAEKVLSFEGMTEYKLDNGLQVVLFPDASQPVVTVNITYLVGSHHESYGETGMAHLLEHLMFKGSKKHPALDQEIGARGGFVNATTSYDRTNYFEVLPADEANLSWALEMEADRMLNAFIAKRDLDTEMTVVRNEFEMGENNAIGILLERMLSSAYLWHNYGHAVIGARSDIENVPIDRLQAFYRKFYQPDNAVLVIAGNFAEQPALDMVEKYFGKMKRPSRVLMPAYTAEPAQDGERSVTLQRVGNSRALGVTYHIPASAHPDFAAVQVLAEMLGGSSGRLHKELVDSGLAVGLMVDRTNWREAGTVSFLVTMRNEQNAAAVREKLLAVLTEAGDAPPPATELEQARQRLLNDMEDALNSPKDVGIQLTEWIASGDWRLFFLQHQRLQQVTADDVARVAKTYFVKENRTVGEFIPTSEAKRAEIPPVTHLDEALKGLTPLPGITPGEVFDTSPQNIDRRTVTPEISGGLHLSFLPKTTRGQMVETSMQLHFGSAELLKNKALAGELAAAMLMRGTARHNRQEIENQLVRNHATLSVDGDATGVDVALRAPKEQLPAVLGLTAEVLRQPAFSETEFAQCKQEYLAYLEESKVDPQRIGVNTVDRHFAPYEPGDVRYVMDFDEKIAALQRLTLADVKQFYQEFYGISTAEMSMVGDVDPQTMTGEVQKLFSDWPGKNAYQRIDSPFVKIDPIHSRILTPDKENAVFTAMIPIKMAKKDPAYPTLVVANYLLGGGGFNSRLGNRIRNQDGLSYHVASHLSIDETDDFGRMTVTAICAPQNMEKVENAFKEEMARALRDGFSQAELENARQGILGNLKINRASDANVAQQMTANLYYHRNFTAKAQLEEKIKALTPQQVLEALRQYIAVENFTIVKAGDFK
ncbi:MAG TPA: pitrilysin family protein [Patescibacteria group bacterium]|nr:pitrilysin family protein [Patescibacteria group bacterium]